MKLAFWDLFFVEKFCNLFTSFSDTKIACSSIFMRFGPLVLMSLQFAYKCGLERTTRILVILVIMARTYEQNNCKINIASRYEAFAGTYKALAVKLKDLLQFKFLLEIQLFYVHFRRR
jgi:hypothetical protein